MGPVSAWLSRGQGIGGAWRTDEPGIIPEIRRCRRVAMTAAAGGLESDIMEMAAGADISRSVAEPATVIAGAVVMVFVFAVADFADPVRVVVLRAVITHAGNILIDDICRGLAVWQQIPVH